MGSRIKSILDSLVANAISNFIFSAFMLTMAIKWWGALPDAVRVVLVIYALVFLCLAFWFLVIGRAKKNLADSDGSQADLREQLRHARLAESQSIQATEEERANNKRRSCATALVEQYLRLFRQNSMSERARLAQDLGTLSRIYFDSLTSTQRDFGHDLYKAHCKIMTVLDQDQGAYEELDESIGIIARYNGLGSLFDLIKPRPAPEHSKASEQSQRP